MILDVNYPASAHYPHIAGAPAVALDPDPEDDFVFKAIKYTENGAQVDASKRFTATIRPHGPAFSKIQRVGRGEPREFVQVRVVETTAYTTVLDYGEATIGPKISAPDIDRAKLGTGFVLSFASSTGQPDRQRFNPFIYDPARMLGLCRFRGLRHGQVALHHQALEVIHKENSTKPSNT